MCTYIGVRTSAIVIRKSPKRSQYIIQRGPRHRVGRTRENAVTLPVHNIANIGVCITQVQFVYARPRLYYVR